MNITLGQMGILETDLDSYLLWHMRHTTVETFPPAEVLEAIESTKHVGGALFSQVALQVFGLLLAARYSLLRH